MEEAAVSAGDGEGESGPAAGGGGLRRHAGPVTQRSLARLGREGGVRVGWREYRVLVLEWLGGVGVGGIGELGAATMRGLMGGRE